MIKQLKSPYNVPNLDRALSIFDMLRENPAGLNMTEISRQLGISMNSVYRITMTLVERGYLDRDDKTKLFRISGKLLSLGSVSISEANLSEIAIDVMRELRDVTKETVLLGTLLPSKDKGIAIEQVPGLHPFKFLMDVGTEQILHVGSPGKCLLGFLPEAEREKIIARLTLTRFTKNTITSKERLREELAEARLKGYALDRGEWMEEMRCVGAPVLDRYSYPVAAIWVTGPSTRMPVSSFSKFGEQVKEHARRISEKIANVKIVR